MTDTLAAIAAIGVVPVVTVPEPGVAVPLTTALVGGGLPVVEITLRTDAGLESIETIGEHVEGAIVGAGSVTSTGAASAALDRGARFLVSPGLVEDVVEVARERGVPVIPGIATPTELLQAVGLGVHTVKLFPAEVVGGLAMIDALAPIWPDVRFMPTGGIGADTATAYLAHERVLAVGGSWMVPGHAVAAHDWAAVRRSANATTTRRSA